MTEYSLKWDGVGLDSEPDARLYLRIMDNARGLVPMLLPRLWDHERPRRAPAAYAALVDRIRADGYSVTHDQFPLIADERWAGSTLLFFLVWIGQVVPAIVGHTIPTALLRHTVPYRPQPSETEPLNDGVVERTELTLKEV